MKKNEYRTIGACWLAAGFVAAASLLTAGTIDLTNGTAAQTSTHPAGPPQNGINGTTTDFTHTNAGADTDPVWQAQFPASVEMTGIILHNRDSCCYLRFSDLTVEVLEFTGDVTQDFGDFPRVLGSGSDGGTVIFTSPVLNPGDEMDGPPEIFVDLIDLYGGPVTGNMIRVHRTNAGVVAGGDPGAGHDQATLSLGEVVALGTGPVLSIYTDEVRMVAGQTITDLDIGSVLDPIEDDGAVTVSIISGEDPPALTATVANDGGDLTATITSTAALAPGYYEFEVEARNSSDETDVSSFSIYIPIGAVAQYKLDETAGPTLVESLRGLDGTWENGLPTFGSTDIPTGATGTSVEFNGSDLVWGSAPASDLFQSYQFTVSFWSKSGGGDWRTPVSHLASGNTEAGGGWILEYGPDNTMYMAVFGPGANPQQSWINAPAPTDGEWHHWVGQFDGQNMILFMDTIPQAIGAGNYAPQKAPDRTMAIGANFFWGEPMLGNVDDVQFYDCGIGYSDILELYANPGMTVTSIDPRIYITVNSLSVPVTGSTVADIGSVFDVEDLPDTLTVTATLPDKAAGITLDVTNVEGRLQAEITADGAAPGVYQATVEVTDSSGDSSINIFDVVVEGLIAHWDMDDAVGSTELLDSVGGNNATIWGVPTLGVAGVAGTAVQFPGDLNNYAHAQNYEDLQLPIFSVSFWADGDPAGAHEAVVASRDFEYLNTENGWIFYYVDGNCEFWMHNDAATGWTSINTPTSTGWHHFVGAYDGSVLTMYMDGVESTAYGSPKPFNGYFGRRASRSVLIGRNGTEGGFPFNGVVDDVQYYSRALTADQALTLYQNPGTTIADETPVRDWTLY